MSYVLNLLAGIWAIGYIVTILGCIPYGIWVIISLLKKKWKRVGILLSIPVAAYLCLWGASAICGASIRSDHLPDIYNANAELGPPIY